MLIVALALAVTAPAAPPSSTTVAGLVAQYGEPQRSVEETERTRSREEPLMLYWMQAKAPPLDIEGLALPGTLVANFAVAAALEQSPLQSFTFLGGGGAEQTRALETELRRRGWVKGEKVVERKGGRFRELTLRTSDGRQGTLALRLGSSGGKMADGRPSPSLWLHLAPAS